MAHGDTELTAAEIRVLGCLIEKERATPDQYPLSTNALRTACNQKTARDPVVDYSDAVVDEAMLSLRDHGHARTVRGSGRTVKHKQVLDEALALDGGEVSLLGVLFLRGAQTVNELRTRTERLHPFESNDDVEAALARLAARAEPLVTCIGKASGQREARWVHLMAEEDAAAEDSAITGSTAAEIVDNVVAFPATGHVDAEADVSPQAESTRPAVGPAPAMAAVGPGERSATIDQVADLTAEVVELRAELDELRRRFDDLSTQLGL